MHRELDGGLKSYGTRKKTQCQAPGVVVVVQCVHVGESMGLRRGALESMAHQERYIRACAIEAREEGVDVGNNVAVEEAG